MKDPQELGVVSSQRGGKDLRSRRVLRSRGPAVERIGEFLHCASLRCWQLLRKQPMGEHRRPTKRH